MSKPAALYCLLLCTAHALFVAESAIPNHWSSFYYHRAFAGRQQQQAAQCDASAVSPASLVCKSARLTMPGGNNTYIHVCPVDGNSTAVCFNSKLDRCCQNEGVSCISKTTLRTVANKVVEVKLSYNTTGQICIDFNEDISISRCCPLIDPGFPENCERSEPPPTLPPPPPCVPKRDIYFVIDSTDSVGNDTFCRFGYVLQLITAAVNPQGVSDGTRMAAVLFESGSVPAAYLFRLNESCDGIVSTNISRVVYEYYAFDQINSADLWYPNVRAKTTQPYSALTLVRNSAREERNSAQEETGRGRPSSVVIMTDGKSHQTVTGVINDLITEIGGPLIAAGIGGDTNATYLETLATNPSTVVYEQNRNKSLQLGIRIIEAMRDTAALCADEAERILAALNATQETDVQEYCQSCLWMPKENRDPAKCDGLMPICGAQNLMMQSFVDSKSNKVFSAEWEKLLLEGEIAKAVENVIAKING